MSGAAIWNDGEDQDGKRPDSVIVRLWADGREVAERMYERHRLLTSWLTSLGVSPEVAANDACRMEHVISNERFEAMKAHA